MTLLLEDFYTRTFLSTSLNLFEKTVNGMENIDNIDNAQNTTNQYCRIIKQFTLEECIDSAMKLNCEKCANDPIYEENMKLNIYINWSKGSYFSFLPPELTY